MALERVGNATAVSNKPQVTPRSNIVRVKTEQTLSASNRSGISNIQGKESAASEGKDRFVKEGSELNSKPERPSTISVKA